MRIATALILGACALARAFEWEPENPGKENTYFNSVKVPPMVELRPENFEEAVSSVKYLMIKHYSPYCPHCIDYAPTYQTLYEYYYTSQPVGTEDNFTSYYDFRFASINCIAFYDLCSKHEVTSYPTTILYENGELKERMKGVKTMSYLSDYLEGVLEEEHKGSRPETIELPKAGSKSSPDFKGEIIEPEKEEGKGAKKVKGKPATGKTASDNKTKETKVEDEKPEETDKVEKTGETESTPTPKSGPAQNIDGISVPLYGETFDANVTNSQQPWFVKFYAPWCHHCQAMAPNWQQMAKKMQGKLNIGEVNCDEQSRLCKEMGVRAFPTIYFFRGEEKVEYQGLRGLGDFVQYAEEALTMSEGVVDVDATSLGEMEKTEDVIFIYLYDHATTTEDFMALEKLPLSLIGRARLVKTNDKTLYDRYKITTWPRLLVSREGRPTYFTPLTPRGMRDVNGILAWMKSVWLPIVPELTAANAREIMDGKVVVLGILDRLKESSFETATREIKSAAGEWMDRQIQEFQSERKRLRDAKQMRIEEAADRSDERALRNAKNIVIDMDKAARKEVAFAWVDGVFWQRWIKTTYGVDVADGERIIINDEDNHRYWDTTVTGNYILVSRTSIMETLEKVMANPHSIRPKLTISSFEKIFFDIRVFYTHHTYIAMSCTIAGLVLFVQWYRGKLGRRRAGNFLRLDDLGMKESMIGMNGNGKVD